MTTFVNRSGTSALATAVRVRGLLLASSLSALLVFSSSAPAQARPLHGFVLGSDYQAGTGTVSVIDLATRAVTRDVATVSSDPVGRWHDGRLYVVNRFGFDNVQVIDPAQGYATVLQFSVGNGSNPQDIAFAGPHRAYVSRLGDPALLRVDPTTGAVLGTLSLAPFADADGNPEAAHMVVVGDDLLVALGRLTNFAPSDTGMIAVVDLRADTLLDLDPDQPGTQALRIHANPWTDFVRFDPATPGGVTTLWIGCAGQWGTKDGGIEQILVPASGPITAQGLVAGEAALGGDLLDLAGDPVTGDRYAVVSDSLGSTSVVWWNSSVLPVQPITTVFSPGGFSISDAGLDGRGELLVCDGSFSGTGIYAFAGDSLLAGPLSTGLPPVGIVFDDSATSAPPAQGGTGLALGLPWPNPAGDLVRLSVALARPGPVRIELFDVTGRRVRVLADETFGVGATELMRPLTDASDRRLTPGVYVIRARALGSEVRRRIVVDR